MSLCAAPEAGQAWCRDADRWSDGQPRRGRRADIKPVPNGRAAAGALRLSWRHATLRRRATVVTLAALPFLVASVLTAILLSYGRDPRVPPPRVERSPDGPGRQTAVEPGGAGERSSEGNPKPAGQTEGSESAGGDRPVTARATGRRSENGERRRRPRGRRLARRVGARPRLDRRNSAAPSPVPHSPSRTGRPGGDGRRPVPNPGPLPIPGPQPISTLAPPPADATATPPIVRQPAPEMTEPNLACGGDRDPGRPATTPVGEAARGAPAPCASEGEHQDHRGAPHRPAHAQEPHPQPPPQAGGEESRAAGPLKP
jgi:hypothetical protein